jgi:hypothetical protein
MLPKFKEEIKASGELILRASNELENEKKKYMALQKTNGSLQSKLKDSKGKNSQTDDYIEQLQ